MLYSIQICCNHLNSLYTLLYMIFSVIHKALLRQPLHSERLSTIIKYIILNFTDWINYLTMFSLPISQCITIRNNFLCVYDRMFNPTVMLQIIRFLICLTL